MKEALLISTLTARPEAPVAFGGLTVRPETLRAIHRLGWTEPTPIQTRVIPLLAQGRDLIGEAQTGSGKTGAYGIPLVERLDPTSRELQALVLVPTRELALQVTDDLRALGGGRGVTMITLFGGQPIERQLAALRRRPQIAVATPGRMLDHLQRGTVSLGAIAVTILDEADRMLDMGFLPDVSKILSQTPASRQTALFSATMPNEIRALAEQRMRQPIWVRIAAPVPTVESVEQFYVEVAEEDKIRALRRLLKKEQVGSALVFRRTKHRADRLARALGREHLVGVLHGGMRQQARLQALRAFEEKRTPLLITTNVASRGLDLPDISHVINFDMPEDVDTYIHRVGRTARAGRPGTAITFVGQHDLEVFDQLCRRLGPAFRRHPLNLYA
ncbi:MAG TPA: DEAD/DEAH box helicase [bacterium]|jgi:ATP-dependent RNA helicase DeaD|nr:DEAD/DEAH box helicase [bacterium]